MTFVTAVVAGFFPTDNFLGYVLPLIQNATQEKIWANISTYLLGPTLISCRRPRWEAVSATRWTRGHDRCHA